MKNAKQYVLAVPNFSEGRRQDIIDAVESLEEGEAAEPEN